MDKIFGPPLFRPHWDIDIHLKNILVLQGTWYRHYIGRKHPQYNSNDNNPYLLYKELPIRHTRL
jgi:hypothetical protein